MVDPDETASLDGGGGGGGLLILSLNIDAFFGLCSDRWDSKISLALDEMFGYLGEILYMSTKTYKYILASMLMRYVKNVNIHSDN